MSSIISVRKLSVSVEKILVNEVSFEHRMGAVLGIYGPNGSGKTTMLKTICGMRSDKKVSGEVWIGGLGQIEEMSPAERVRHILYMASDFKSPFHLTVRELLELGAKTASSELWPELQSGDRARIAEVVESMNLNSFLSRELETLSDGEKQLMMFARCLVQNPQVIALDESFSKLDLDHLMLVGKMIRRWTEKGTTFLLISHDLNFISEVADDILFMRQSQLLAKGPVNDVMTDTVMASLYPGVPMQVVRSPQTGNHKILY